jgi:hypothetical protein
MLHPAVPVLTKAKRWMHIADSTRPASIQKASNDIADIKVILRWLSERKIRIDFAAYPEKPKGELLPAIRMMYVRHADMRGLLEATMAEEDFALIRS